jgi:hypothetical protein
MDKNCLCRSQPLMVTALSAEPVCALRAVLRSERASGRLPPHPEAILGTIVHNALRHCGNRGADAVLAEVRTALSGPQGIIDSAATVSGSISLRDVIPATRLSAKLAAARRFAAADLQDAERARGASSGLGGFGASSRSARTCWSWQAKSTC